MPHFTFHALRHTFATRMMESGVPAKVVQEILKQDEKLHTDVYYQRHLNYNSGMRRKSLTFLCLIPSRLIDYCGLQADSVSQEAVEDILDRSRAIFDVLIVDGCEDITNPVPDLHYCRSFETGVITMTNAVIGKVNAQHGIKLAEDQITAAIRGDKRLVLPQNIIDDILVYAKDHVNAILDELRENMVELKANPAIFIGGGSILFKPFIESSPMITRADFVPDEKANAIGYAMLAAHQLRKASV